MAKQVSGRHEFTEKIFSVLGQYFPDFEQDVFDASPLIGYLNKKTKSANRGSKSRGSFANHYALYVVVEDYINKGFASPTPKSDYSKYEGARFSDLFRRQRELPFGAKLQNHALNSRLNEEFKKFYPTLGKVPIVRDVEKQRYWIQEDLLLVSFRDRTGKDVICNIAHALIEIIDLYVATKREAFEGFIETCKQISSLASENPSKSFDFIVEQLKPNVDARVFEIVSYAVLKAKYAQQSIWIGNDRETVEEKLLSLFKTGRTNANDGGIDFVMRPLGRFFQVTETVDVSKYFLDIDKVQRFPITFVVKSDESSDTILSRIKKAAISKYKIEQVVDSYMSSIEEIINIPRLVQDFRDVTTAGKLQDIMDEIIIQSRVEFNLDEEDEDNQEDA